MLLIKQIARRSPFIQPLTKDALGAFLILFAISSAFAAGVPESRHVILLDVSGSMEQEGPVRYARYSSGQMTPLVQQLLEAIRKHDQSGAVVIQPFSSSRDTYPSSSRLVGPTDVLAALPKTARGAETELDYALQLGLDRYPNASLYLITDNKNDFRGNRSDQKFYDSLARDPKIHTVYFVPLAQPGSNEDALVMYAVAGGLLKATDVAGVVSDFARSVQSEAVQFRGFYTTSGENSLVFGQKIFQVAEDGEERPAETEADAVVLSYDEGRAVDGSLRFRIRSNLRHWKIVDGELKKVQVRLTMPGSYTSSGDFELPLSLSGSSKINVSPGGDSAEIYTLPLSAISEAGISLRRRNLFTRRLADIPARVRLHASVRVSERPELSGMKPDFSPTLQQKIRAVRNLALIMNLMTLQPDVLNSPGATERVIQFDREVLVRVRPDGLQNLLATTIVVGIPTVLAIAAIFSIVAFRVKRFALSGPDGKTRDLAFSVFSRHAPVHWNERPVASLQRALNGTFHVRPERGYTVDHSNLLSLPARFEITSAKSHERGQFELRPRTSSSKTAPRKERYES